MRTFKHLLIIALLSSLTNSFAQALPTKDEQFTFLKWYAQYKQLVPSDDKIISVSRKLIETYDLKRIFIDTKQSKANKDYIKKQAYLLKRTLTLDTATLRKLNWSKTSSTQEKFITNMSIPIFSIDRSLVIVSYEIFCGPQCGKQGTDVFIKNKNNKWIPAHTRSIPVSF